MLALRRLVLVLAAVVGGACAARAASLDTLAVDAQNMSEPVLCAEKDNVAINFTSPEVRNFKIDAQHPAYMGSLMADRFAADWTACDMTGDPAFPAEPRKVTIYESNELWVIGYTYPAFWRQNDVPVKIGDRVEHGLHLIQVWVLDRQGAYETLVLYPPDGYWRARPLPPDHLRWAAYGSSFMIGPVEYDKRPVVNLKSIAFDPKTRTFDLAFKAGGSAQVAMESLDQDRQVLDVTFDKPVSGTAFAALRSMYITEFNADVARIATRGPGAPGWEETPVMAFGKAKVTDLWAGRLVPSRHNTSAPDMVFRAFRPQPEPAKPEPQKPAAAKP